MHDRKLKVSSISGVQMLPFRNPRAETRWADLQTRVLGMKK